MTPLIRLTIVCVVLMCPILGPAVHGAEPELLPFRVKAEPVAELARVPMVEEARTEVWRPPLRRPTAK